MKKFMIVICIIIMGLTAFFSFLFTGMNKTIELDIDELKLDRIADGTYIGNYEGAGRFNNEISVKVKDNAITEIIIMKTVMVEDATVSSYVTSEVLSRQSTIIDAISGATATQKAYLKAIENALK